MEQTNHIANDPQQATVSLDHAKSVLQAKLDPSWIQKRKQGGATLSYIGGHIVIQLLNEAFNYNWNYEVLDKQIIESRGKLLKDKQGKPRKNEDGTDMYTKEAPYVEVRARLTVPGYGFKEQYGSKTMIGGASEQESATKAASTDALKKCASLYGIGLELYGDDTEKEVMEKFETAQVPIDHTVNEEQPKEVKEPEPEQPAAEKPETKQESSGNTGGSTGSTSKQQTTSAPSGSTEQTTSSRNDIQHYDPNEVNDLRELKQQMGIKENSELNPFVQEFFEDGNKTAKNLSADVIGAFNTFLRSKMQEQAQQESEAM